MRKFLNISLAVIIIAIVFNSKSNTIESNQLENPNKVENILRDYPFDFCVDPPNFEGIDEAHDGQFPLPPGDYQYYFVNKDNLDPALIVKRKYCFDRVFSKLKNLSYTESDTLGLNVYKVGSFVHDGTFNYVGTTNEHIYFKENAFDTTIFNSHYGWVESPLPTYDEEKMEWIIPDDITCRLEEHELNGHGFPAMRHGHLNPINGYQYDYEKIASDLGITIEEAQKRYGLNSRAYYWNPFDSRDVMNYGVNPNWVLNPEIQTTHWGSSNTLSENEWNRNFELYGEADEVIDEVVDTFKCDYKVGDYVYYLRRASMAPGVVQTVVPEPKKNRCRNRIDLVNSNYFPISDGSRMIKIHNQEVIDYYFVVDESLSTSDREFLDRYGAEIDRINAQLRGLE